MELSQRGGVAAVVLVGLICGAASCSVIPVTSVIRRLGTYLSLLEAISAPVMLLCVQIMKKEDSSVGADVPREK